VAHAEASARTVEAAVTAAAAQLGLRPDQVDVEVLEDPVPSTFGYIGTPARVRVIPRQPAAPPDEARDAAHGSPPDAPVAATSPQPSDATRAAAGQSSDAIGGAAAGRPPDATQVADPAPHSGPAHAVPAQASSSAESSSRVQSPGSEQAAGPAHPSDSGQVFGAAQDSGSGQAPDPARAGASLASDPTQALGSGRAADPTQAPGPGSADPIRASGPGHASGESQASGPTQASPPSSAAGSPLIQPSAQGTNYANRTGEATPPSLSETAIQSPSSSAQVPHRHSSDPARDSTPTGSAAVEARDLSGQAATQTPPSGAPPAPAAGRDAPDHTGGAVREAPDTAAVTTAPDAQPSSSMAASGGNHGAGPEGASAVSTAAAASAMEKTPPVPSVSERPTAPRPRRGYRDDPIEPEMVEADTERAGDFLEGLLDALDVDGDITTWIDEAGGHIDLEGSDLDLLVGSNGETLDALQELTRIAVLRQSKRRVRLLLDINGFRSRQRERLVSVVKATAERVIRSREEHEFEPMTPAERKVVHDAVAAIDGVRTESLGEDPYRRVVIRPT
jgi:spoIIIJ-associated protein